MQDALSGLGVKNPEHHEWELDVFHPPEEAETLSGLLV